MRGGSAALIAAALLAGCAGGRETPPEIDPAADLCRQVAELAAAGQHKPAVDLLASLGSSRDACPEAVAAAARESRQRLDAADARAREGLAARDAGEVEAAREHFLAALEIYPRYSWVSKLERDLPRDDPEETARRIELARAGLTAAGGAQRAGDLRAAVSAIGQAVAARPEGDLAAEVVEFASRLGQKLFSAGELVDARAVWRAALELDPADDRLREFLAEVELRLENLARIEDGG